MDHLLQVRGEETIKLLDGKIYEAFNVEVAQLLLMRNQTRRDIQL